MMRAQNAVPRERRTPEYQTNDVLKELLHVFLACVPGADEAVFRRHIVEPVRSYRAGGDALAEHWKAQNGGKLGLIHQIQICCAYCFQAAQVLGKAGLARSYLMDAHLYLGIAAAGATSGPQVEELRKAVGGEAVSANAQRSVKVSADPWRKAKAEAWRLIREAAQGRDPWATASEAARNIAGQVEKYLETLEPRKRFQGPQQRNVKIAQWLRQMPEAPQLFASSAKKLKAPEKS
jgi:hypothetical protein